MGESGERASRSAEEENLRGKKLGYNFIKGFGFGKSFH